MTLPGSEDEMVLLTNPKCSKCRAAVALLEERDVDFETRLYLEDPLGLEELADLGRRLGKRPLEFTRVKEAEFEDAGLDESSSADEILSAMATKPILLERPILVRGKNAKIGRPPEDLLQLLDAD